MEMLKTNTLVGIFGVAKKWSGGPILFIVYV